MVRQTSRKGGSYKNLRRLAIGLGVIILIISGYLWWTKVFNSPSNVFEGMIERSLSTNSVTRKVSQASSNGQQDEFTQINFGAQNFAHTMTTVKQKDQNGKTATIKSESIGTPKDDYARYVSIKTEQKDQNGKPLDYSKVENVWGKSNTDVTQSPVRYFNQAILGIVPFGNLGPREREALLTKIRQLNVYTPDYAHVQKKKEQGRSVYVYSVSIQPQAYVTMLQNYSQALGIGSIPGLDPSSYAGAQPINLQLTVDILSRQLRNISYLGEQTQGARQETYDGYGGLYRVDFPKKTVSFSELQSRVQNIQ